jgi:hypothetical protein
MANLKRDCLGDGRSPFRTQTFNNALNSITSSDYTAQINNNNNNSIQSTLQSKMDIDSEICKNHVSLQPKLIKNPYIKKKSTSITISTTRNPSTPPQNNFTLNSPDHKNALRRSPSNRNQKHQEITQSKQSPTNTNHQQTPLLSQMSITSFLSSQ